MEQNAQWGMQEAQVSLRAALKWSRIQSLARGAGLALCSKKKRAVLENYPGRLPSRTFFNLVLTTEDECSLGKRLPFNLS